MSYLKILEICKWFGTGKNRTQVVKHVHLEVEEGEFLAILGPSGCGKTTTLRVIAGLEQADSGQIILDGEDISDLSPERRPVVMVFQSHLLFPFLSVFENIAFGLRLAKIPKAQVRERVLTVLDQVQLRGYEDRFPSQLSAGQKQRVSLARALVLKPKILLLDEPLANLDTQLRKEMGRFIRSLQKELNITMIFVTHDQDEAASLADRVMLMHKGKALQIGTPEELYQKPDSALVAAFFQNPNCILGEKKGNAFESEQFSLNLKDLALPPWTARRQYNSWDDVPDGSMMLAIRPEDISLEIERVEPRNEKPRIVNNHFQMDICIEHLEYRGGVPQCRFTVGKDLWLALPGTAHSALNVTEGHAARISVEKNRILLLPIEDGEEELWQNQVTTS